MPVERDDLSLMAEEGLMSADEIETVAKAAAEIGFRKIRLTGGEPLLRRDVVDIVARLSAVPGIDDLAMTTNGILLPRLAKDLKQAGLRRVNIHIDSLRADRLPMLMRWGSLDALWAGIEAAEAAGLTPIKINVVVAAGHNDDEVAELAKLSLEHDWSIRFIELMPLGLGSEAQFAIDRFVSNEKVKADIEASLGPLQAIENSDPSDEALNFRIEGAPGRIGFISPVSQPYCGHCNRMRLTADGRLHLCLLHDDELDIRAALRASDPEMRSAAVKDGLKRAITAKPTGHALKGGIHTEGRRMHAIGG